VAQRRRKPRASEEAVETYETAYRGRRIRIERPRATGEARAAADAASPARLFIDDEEVPVEVSESGVIGHDMAFKEYGSLEELAEDIIRQRGTAEISRGDGPHPPHR
jgi:hypothetical protein